VWEDLKPSDILSAASFDNAVTAAMALGGSTNAIIHLVAMAGRAGVDLPLSRFDEISRRTPLVANLRPSGKYLMEDFYYAGGLRALLSRIPDLLDTACLTVTGQSLAANIDGARIHNEDVILPRNRPLATEGGVAVLYGNLAPGGAVIKPSAMEERFLKHTGPAVVFRDYNDMAARIDDPKLEVNENSVLVLKNAGPLGGPGMPEWGMLPIPKKLLQKGVRDMVRISDARMSGTSYGSCVLHVSPESYVGGPLAFVEEGDPIRLDVRARKLELQVPEERLAARRARWKAPPPRFVRGYGVLFANAASQADRGCDFNFLEGAAPTPEPEIH
jgi:dihydroxyacid dehydratase/phosphogluconate dehydratase